MTEFIFGVLGFVKVMVLILLIIELTILLEEFLAARIELRRGFAGTKTSLIQVLARHGLKILRTEGPLSRQLASATRYLVIFLSAGLLPVWGGKIPLAGAHSLWLFTALVIFGPVFHLISDWARHRGAGWPLVLASAERTVGASTVHFILAITLVAMTGIDDFAGFRDLQEAHGWIIWRYPWAIFILFAYAVANLFTSFQSIFSRGREERAEGWSFDDLLPHLRRAVWTLFVVDVFMGGAGKLGPLGDLSLIVKCVGVNVVSKAISQLFFHLREDQAESFILWRLMPISILILGLSLLIPGGVF